MSEIYAEYRRGPNSPGWLRSHVEADRFQLIKGIRETFPNDFPDDDDPTFRAMLVLLCAIHWGTTNWLWLRRLTGLPPRVVKPICQNFRKNEIFRGKGRGSYVLTVNLSVDGAEVVMGLLLDAMVGAGTLAKSWVEE